MISFGSKRHTLRNSQPFAKPSTATIVNENGPAAKSKILLQQMVVSKKAPSVVQAECKNRVFGRNILNLPLGRRQRNDSKLKQELKNELTRLRGPSVPSSLNASIVPIENIMDIPPLLAETLPPVPVIEPMVLEKSPDTVRGNPQACEEYTGEIDVYLRSIENRFIVNPAYMEAQSDINEKMRAILVDWLVDVHIRFKLIQETLFLTVNLIDRFLEKENLPRDRLQLLGVTTMLIASKYEEIYPPEVKDFVYITDNAYTKEDILMMEQRVLKVLEFNLNVPSSNRFLQRFSKTAGTDAKTYNLAKYLIELPLTELGMLKYCASIIAAAGLYEAYKMQGKEGMWCNIGKTIGYTKEELDECAKDMNVLMHMSGKGSLQALKKKFSSLTYMEVAKLKA